MNTRRSIYFVITIASVTALRALLEEGVINAMFNSWGGWALFSPAILGLVGCAGALWLPIRPTTTHPALKVFMLSTLSVFVSELLLAFSEWYVWHGMTGYLPNGTSFDYFAYRQVHSVPIMLAFITIVGGITGGAMTIALHLIRVTSKKAGLWMRSCVPTRYNPTVFS